MRNPSDPVSQGLVTDLENKTLKVRFTVTLANNKNIPGWEGVLWRGRLYVQVTPEHLADGSKESFVSVLEYAEEALRCQHVIVCLDRHAADLKNTIRNFLFLGFQPLAPGHEFLPKNPELVCFVYEI